MLAAPPPLGLVPSPLGNPGSATGLKFQLARFPCACNKRAIPFTSLVGLVVACRAALVTFAVLVREPAEEDRELPSA